MCLCTKGVECRHVIALREGGRHLEPARENKAAKKRTDDYIDKGMRKAEEMREDKKKSELEEEKYQNQKDAKTEPRRDPIFDP